MSKYDFAKEFAMKHPIATYFTVVGSVGTVCRAVVEVTRSITGKYPPATPLSWNITPPEKNEAKEEAEDPFKDIEDKDEWTDDDFS